MQRPPMPTTGDRPSVNTDLERPFVITGGAGFIGASLAQRLLSQGATVILLDDFSSARVEENVTWLKAQFGERVVVERGDVHDKELVRHVVARCAGVFHLAAQAAVSASLSDPVHDFEVNVGGTLNVLEELRQRPDKPFLIYTSTNKVYGALTDLPVSEAGGRYQPMDQLTRARGVGETRRLEFVSPYACSKGAADQYVLDYARTFGLPAAVFRLSCIYGPRQFGTEDQGWVAHLILQTLGRRPVTVRGDGKQVRDLLYVDDLIDAFMIAARDMTRLCGRAFNLGGGPHNTMSLLEMVAAIEELHGRRPELRFCEWRPGEQRYYASDTRAFRLATSWEPQIGVQAGVARLYHWLLELTGRTQVAEPVLAIDESTEPLKRAAP